MAEHIVRTWPRCLLYHYHGNRYGMLLFSGEPIGDEIRAKNDEEAIEKGMKIVHEYRETINEGQTKGQELIETIERMNKADMLDGLSNDELQSLKSLLFVWHDLAKREIDKRKATTERVVNSWADEVLLHLGEDRYQVTTPNGQPMGNEIRAASDEEAIQECIRIARERWGKKE